MGAEQVAVRVTWQAKKTRRQVMSTGLRRWSGGGSNSRPLHCERSALPTELPPQRSYLTPSPRPPATPFAIKNPTHRSANDKPSRRGACNCRRTPQHRSEALLHRPAYSPRYSGKSSVGKAPLRKRSFQDMRSQAGAWKRGGERSSAKLRFADPAYSPRCSGLWSAGRAL